VKNLKTIEKISDQLGLLPTCPLLHSSKCLQRIGCLSDKCALLMLRKSSMLPANSWISQQVKVRQLTEIECSEIDFTYLRCTQQMSNYVPHCLGDVRGVINTSLGGCNETNDAGPSTGGSCKDQFSAQVHFTLRSI
jgi:hypothetical protein